MDSDDSHIRTPLTQPAAGTRGGGPKGLAMTFRFPSATTTSPAIPRLQMEPTGSTRTLLNGGWWPRSTDPAAELPGLVLAIDKVRGPIARLILSIKGWDDHTRRLAVAGRVLRLDYFTSQPVSLLTALCANGRRVDLLVVPPDTPSPTADAAMALAATTRNRIQAQHLLAAAAETVAASPSR